MSSVKEKRFKKLKRKKIWPSIVAFVLFTLLCVGMIALFLQLFALYIMGTKIVQQYGEAQHVKAVLNGFLSNGDSITDAVDGLHKYTFGENNVYVMDSDGQMLIKTGSSEPDFGLVLDFKLNQEFGLDAGFVAVADSNNQFVHEGGPYTIFAMPVDEVIKRTFSPGAEHQGLGSWLNETIITQGYWLRAPLGDGEYDAYVKCIIQLQRQDIFYICIFGIIALLLLMIPIILLFINTLRSIVTQRRMTQLIYLDAVTGGKNWFYFRNYAERILTRWRNSKKPFAIVNLHLERYQNYCACYGVKAGEELLEAMDGFLKARIGKNEFFARFEGADFGLLLSCEGENVQENQENCSKRIRSLLAELSGLKPDQKIHFRAGINMIPPYQPEDGKWYHTRKNVDINQLYTYANAARISDNGADERQITFFDQEMLGKQMWERWVEDTMEEALNNGEFQVYMQPKYSPINGKLVGAEALVRWISPTEGLIAPGRFIPIFEDTGFITQLDDYMISQVAKLQAEWMIQGKKMIPVSVNVSRAHFAQEGLADHICQLVDAYGPKHELIELEVTESAFFDDKDILVETVKQLKAYGFHVSMDDFGAGYSSLNSLKDIPLDVLKLDGEFFRGDDDDGRGQIVVKEAIQLARSLDMRVVAEGIEKKEQVDFLAGQGCDMIQGFYFAKPMPIEEFEEKVEKDA
ncbi:MAG: GGDEF domain-containing phosphodiesterase [Lachnospiraceae bacterium]|nr:GGDEF domain-containing phosphodiesterase [Lachnospiraceae bacterium]